MKTLLQSKHQLIELINYLKADKSEAILEKIQLKCHTIHVFFLSMSL